MTMSVEIERLRTELLTKDGEIEALLGSITLNKRAYNQKLSDSPFKSPKDPLWVRPALGEADTFARQALELKAVEYEEELSQSRAEVALLKQKLASTQEKLQSNEESGRRLAATVSTNSQQLSSDQHAAELTRQENEEELSRSKAETELLKQELASTQEQLQSNEENGRRLAATAFANSQQLSLEQVADALRRQENEEELSQSKAEVELLKQNLTSTQAQLAANDQARLRQKLEQSSYKLQEVLAKLSAAEEEVLYVQQEGGERELALRHALGEKEGRVSELEEQSMSWKTQVQEATALRIGMDKTVAESNARLNAALTAQRKAEQSFDDLQSTLEDYRVKYTRQFDLRRQYHNYIQEQKGNIRVFCRSRPKSDAEAIEYPVEVLSYPEADRIRVTRQGGDGGADIVQEFEFDEVFTETSKQEDVYREVEPLIESVLDGFNVCIFAYGQTGSGKTYTMEGPSDARGVNSRSLCTLFELVQKIGPEVDIHIEVSMLEIYNDNVRDLLVGKLNKDTNLDIQHVREADGSVRVSVKELTLQVVHSLEEVSEVLAMGYKTRATASNQVNLHSSRSHSIITVNIRIQNNATQAITRSKLHLIDLAGSERLAKTESVDERLKEAQNINKSLSSLADVIAALQKREKFVPYRNSKLTHLLQDSLGGSAKTLMFVNLSPAKDSVGESLSSLNFASRARSVELGQSKANTAHASTAPPAHPHPLPSFGTKERRGSRDEEAAERRQLKPNNGRLGASVLERSRTITNDEAGERSRPLSAAGGGAGAGAEQRPRTSAGGVHRSVSRRASDAGEEGAEQASMLRKPLNMAERRLQAGRKLQSASFH